MHSYHWADAIKSCLYTKSENCPQLGHTVNILHGNHSWQLSLWRYTQFFSTVHNQLLTESVFAICLLLVCLVTKCIRTLLNWDTGCRVFIKVFSVRQSVKVRSGNSRCVVVQYAGILRILTSRQGDSPRNIYRYILKQSESCRLQACYRKSYLEQYIIFYQIHIRDKTLETWNTLIYTYTSKSQ